MKELPVPQEIKEIFDEAMSCIECRDKCIASVFRAKRAIYYGKMAVKLHRKGLALITEMYPETKNGKWLYSYNSGAVYQPSQEQEPQA